MIESNLWPPGGYDPQIDRLADRHISGRDLNLRALLADNEIGRVALASSFGAESSVLIHMVSSISKSIPILFIDTQKHFRETYNYVETLINKLELKAVEFLQPDENLVRQEDPDGILWRAEPDMCCTIRKTFSLQDRLVEFDTWITGRKRFQGNLRSNLPYIERDGVHLKINPLIYFTPVMIKDYIDQHDLPVHPLVERGYRSIGCEPCTSPVTDDQEMRAGRWSGLNKVECGIHLSPDGRISRRSSSRRDKP